MTRDEIIRELSRSDRWGTNYQPNLNEFAHFLVAVDEEVGLDDVTVLDRDYVYFRTRRPLTPRLAFELGLMMLDGAPQEIQNDQTEFNLWWD